MIDFHDFFAVRPLYVMWRGETVFRASWFLGRPVVHSPRHRILRCVPFPKFFFPLWRWLILHAVCPAVELAWVIRLLWRSSRPPPATTCPLFMTSVFDALVNTILWLLTFESVNFSITWKPLKALTNSQGFRLQLLIIRVKLNKRHCQDYNYINNSLTFQNIKMLPIESVNFSKSWERYLLRAVNFSKAESVN